MLRFLVFLVLSLLLACSEESKTSKVFEGKWKWQETKGVDTNGNSYTLNPLTEGYDIYYTFLNEENFSGELIVKTGDQNPESFNYTFDISENALEQTFTLDKFGGSPPEILYWEILKADGVHLYLRNAAYFTDDCCDGKLEYHFVRQ